MLDLAQVSRLNAGIMNLTVRSREKRSYCTHNSYLYLCALLADAALKDIRLQVSLSRLYLSRPGFLSQRLPRRMYWCILQRGAPIGTTRCKVNEEWANWIGITN